MKQFVKKLLRELLKNKKKRRRKINYLLHHIKVENLNKIMFLRYYIADHSSTSTVLDILSNLL